MQDYLSYMFPDVDWVDRLDEIAVSKAAIVGTATSMDAKRAPITPRFDWGFSWIRTSQDRSQKTLILSATNERTADLIKEGQIQFFKRHGIPEDFAIMLYRTYGYRKHEMAPYVGEILNNNDLLEAALAYPGYGIAGARKPWLRDRMAPIVGETHPIITMSFSRCDDLMGLIKFLTNERIKELISHP